MVDVIEGVYEAEESSIVKASGINEFNTFEDFYENFNPREYLLSGDDIAARASSAVADMDCLKVKLEAADKFAGYACEFCLKEAQIYIEIANIDGAEAKLKGVKKKVVTWIRGKANTELSSILRKVGFGRRIHLVMQDENKVDNKAIEMGEYERISDMFVEELQEYGCVELTTSGFMERWKLPGKHPNVGMVNAYTKTTRDKLLRNNGLGFGDGNGTYMLLEKCSSKDVAKIVETRLTSIVADLASVKEICKKRHFAVPDKGIKMIVDLAMSLRSPSSCLDVDEVKESA